jgi:hypothetical protein
LDKLVPAPEHGNRISRLEPSRDRLHDAVFASSVAGFSIMEDDRPLDESSVLTDTAGMEAFFNDCLPVKSNKSPSDQIDNINIYSALRH